ncbi:hypothetical protein POMI540_4007 [Schizosaccharomyces pombe]
MDAEGEQKSNGVKEPNTPLREALDEIFLNVGYLLRSLLANVPNALYHSQLQAACQKFQDYCDLEEIRIIEAKRVVERDLRSLEAKEVEEKSQFASFVSATPPGANSLQGNVSLPSGNNFFTSSFDSDISKPGEVSLSESQLLGNLNQQSSIQLPDRMPKTTNGTLADPNMPPKTTVNDQDVTKDASQQFGGSNFSNYLRDNDSFQFGMNTDASGDAHLQASEFLLPNLFGNSSTSPQDNFGTSNSALSRNLDLFGSPSSENKSTAGSASLFPNQQMGIDLQAQENYSAAFGNDGSFASHLTNTFDNALNLPTDIPTTESINDLFGENFDFTMTK